MVIFGFLTNVSIAKLFAGGMLVGVLFGVSFMAVAVWSLGVPVIVLGGILGGVVTVTEAAALAVFYSLLWPWPSTGSSNGKTCRVSSSAPRSWPPLFSS